MNKDIESILKIMRNEYYVFRKIRGDDYEHKQPKGDSSMIGAILHNVIDGVN